MYRSVMTAGCFVLLAVGILAMPSVRAIAQEAEGADDAEKAAVAEIRKLGGSVRRLASNTNDKEVDFHLTGTDLTGADLLGATTGFWEPEGIEDAIWGATTCPDGTNSDPNAGTCRGHFGGKQLTTTTFSTE